MALIFVNSKADSGIASTLSFGQDVSRAYLVQGGFQTGYSGSDHHVKTIKAEFDSIQEQPASVNFTPEVEIEDASGNSGGGTLYVLGIGQTAGDPTQFATKRWNAGDGKVTLSFSGQKLPIDFATVFIQNFDLTYGNSDHHVQAITIDTGNANLSAASAQASDGTYTWTVTFTPSLLMKDDSGNTQSSSSFLSLLIMAVPQS